MVQIKRKLTEEEKTIIKLVIEGERGNIKLSHIDVLNIVFFFNGNNMFEIDEADSILQNGMRELIEIDIENNFKIL